MYGQSMPRVDHFKGILFDSGDTLVRPTGGRWNPRYDFESVLLRYFPDIKGDAFPEAFAAGQRMLDAAPRTADRAEYHRVILRVLDIADPPQNLLRELQQPADCLFVDDDPLLVDAAIALGYQGVVIDRGSPGSGRIASLDELIRPRFRL